MKFPSLVVVLWLGFWSPPGSPFEWPFDRITNSTNGQFQYELVKITDYATSLRNGIKCYLDGKWLQGVHGLVVKVKFEDDLEWAVKIADVQSDFNSVTASIEAVESSKMIERYCPEIPIPKVRGQLQFLLNSTLGYYLMDWVEGEALKNRLEPPWSSATEHTIPNTTLVQLADLFYNLTVCEIPEIESEIFLDVANSCIVSRLLSREHWNAVLYPFRHFSTDSLPSTRDWAKACFLMSLPFLWIAEPSEDSEGSYNGLDLMILFTWVLKQFSPTDPQTFVLYFWDPQCENILLDKQDNLKAYLRPNFLFANKLA
jgi:hypothetical protein